MRSGARGLFGVAALALSFSALAGPEDSREALDRAQELLALRIESGALQIDQLSPAILVSARPRYVDSEGWYTNRAVEVLSATLGPGALRYCEACSAPRAWVGDGQLVYESGATGLEEVIRLDETLRGAAQPARAAVWLDEVRGGVALRVVDLDTGAVLLARNLDPTLVELKNTRRIYTLTEELERRARGDALTQGFFDAALYPSQHVSLDWTDQWGAYNENLSGLTISLIDPVLGLGACHYRRVPRTRALLGGQALVSVPTALVQGLSGALGEDAGDLDLFDPMVTLVGVARVPFGRANYGAVFTASTAGHLAVGISMMNTTLLPVLP